MKNMSVGDIKPKDDEDDVQVINPPSSLSVPQDDDKNERVENKDIHVSHEQAEAQAQDVDAPQPPLKWLIEDIHPYFKHIHKISS
jgi:hypothetical protein